MSESTEPTWPPLALDDWRATYATLHRWLQVVGKVRLATMPWINHSWQVTLYITGRGLSTGPMPLARESFQIDLDFIDHQLAIVTTDGLKRDIPLQPRPVADFYRAVFAALAELKIHLTINPMPNEIPNPTPLNEDHDHASYDPEAAHRFWRALAAMERVFTRFRARFCGKCSPVHFFWGSFDLAVTRFSGRPAPPHPGGAPHLPNWVARDAYFQEVSSAGFWPGGEPMPEPVFYCYAYPTPDGFARAAVQPEAAYYSEALDEFVLPYQAVREAGDPAQTLLAFLESTYRAAADAGGWDRARLEYAG